MDAYDKAAQQIINAQKAIIGPLAIEEAKKIHGITMQLPDIIVLSGNKAELLEELVRQYELFFGKASLEICKEAAKQPLSQLPTDQVPQLLRS